MLGEYLLLIGYGRKLSHQLMFLKAHFFTVLKKILNKN